MYYKILDLKCKGDIERNRLLPHVFYSPYRKEILDKVDCRIQCEAVNSLLPPKGELCYVSPGEYLIFKNANGEYRCFFDISVNEPSAILEDWGNQKKLYINQKLCPILSEMALFNFLGLEKNLNNVGKMILHSSFIYTEKGAVLFSAPSGVGKSTQAELWRKYKGAEIINGDRAGIFQRDGIWMAGGVPWAGTSGIMKNRIEPIAPIIPS